MLNSELSAASRRSRHCCRSLSLIHKISICTNVNTWLLRIFDKCQTFEVESSTSTGSPTSPSELLTTSFDLNIFSTLSSILDFWRLIISVNISYKLENNYAPDKAPNASVARFKVRLGPYSQQNTGNIAVSWIQAKVDVLPIFLEFL